MRMIVTVHGQERSGIMSDLAALTVQHGGDWLSTRMSHMEGRFIGLINIVVPEQNAEALKQAFINFDDIQADFHHPMPITDNVRIVPISLQAQDNPGTISRISKQLRDLDVDIDHIDVQRLNVPGSATNVVNAEINLRVHSDIDQPLLQAALNRVDDNIVVHILDS